MDHSEIIQIDNVNKSFPNQGQSEKVLNNVSFSINKGETISVLGKSGCGKSTLLNLIGGFEKVDSGNIHFKGKKVEQPSRDCIMLFQNYGLLPWRSVLKNVELGLENTKLSKKDQGERARQYINLVGLEGKEELFPHQLSGGMQQRVAIARALAIEPSLILMDEPFAALDTFNRYYLQDELLRIQNEAKTTIVLVTHDIDEAIYLSDRIMIMRANPGEIQKEIKVDTAKPRDRSHGNFQHYRKQILDEFKFGVSSPSEEFNI